MPSVSDQNSQNGFPIWRFGFVPTMKISHAKGEPSQTKGLSPCFPSPRPSMIDCSLVLNSVRFKFPTSKPAQRRLIPRRSPVSAVGAHERPNTPAQMSPKNELCSSPSGVAAFPDVEHYATARHHSCLSGARGGGIRPSTACLARRRPAARGAGEAQAQELSCSRRSSGPGGILWCR